jgi:hypothetical protein
MEPMCCVIWSRLLRISKVIYTVDQMKMEAARSSEPSTSLHGVTTLKNINNEQRNL